MFTYTFTSSKYLKTSHKVCLFLYFFFFFFLFYVDFWNDHDRRVKEALTKPAITFQWLCLQPTSGTLVVTEACIAFHIPRSFLNIENWCFDTFSFSCSWVQTCWHLQNGQSARSFHMCRVHCNYYSYSAWLLLICRSWLYLLRASGLYTMIQKIPQHRLPNSLLHIGEYTCVCKYNPSLPCRDVEAV